MTSWSAASLSGRLSSHFPPIPQSLAAAEPPRGRVLVFEDETVIALDLQRILREAGFRVVGPANSIEETSALAARGRTDCAVIDFDATPDRAAVAADILADTGIPVVLMASSRENVPARHAERRLVEKPYAASELLGAVHEAIAGCENEIVYPIAPPPSPFPRVLPQL